MLVDSHCHLDFPQYADCLDDVVARAAANGVTTMQTICTRISKFPEILKVAERFDNVYCSVGLHPNNVAEEAPVTAQEIIAITKHPKVIGIGETGLDYYYEHAPRDKQADSFNQHIVASQETQIPLIVHSRDADTDTVAMLAAAMKKKRFPGLIHCFSTGMELAQGAMDLGFYISISGIVTFKNATALQDIVKVLPLDRLLVETDAPYLAPMPYRGKTNEPAYTRHTAEFIAQLKNISYEDVARVTTRNFFDLFSKAH